MNFERPAMNKAFMATHNFFANVQGEPIPTGISGALQYEALLFDATAALRFLPPYDSMEVLLAVASELKAARLSNQPPTESKEEENKKRIRHDQIVDDFFSGVHVFDMPTKIEIHNAFRIKKLTVTIARRDHTVVTDLTSAKKHKVISRKERENNYPKMKEIFVATKSECQQWIDAHTPEARKAVEQKALENHRIRVRLQSEKENSPILKDQVAGIMKKFDLLAQNANLYPESPAKGKHLAS